MCPTEDRSHTAAGQKTPHQNGNTPHCINGRVEKNTNGIIAHNGAPLHPVLSDLNSPHFQQFTNGLRKHQPPGESPLTKEVPVLPPTAPVKQPEEFFRAKRLSSTTPAMNLNDIPENCPIIYRLVLTGGPCSGKTTGQARLSTFFENLGWKVYRVPETATTLFSGGVRFPDLTKEESEKFQENLVKVMMATEKTFFQLAASSKKNCIIICDRGVMDTTAYMSKECTDRIFRENHWNTVDVRDNRYNSVVHLVTSADGAEKYYNMEGNPTRTEGLELARELDQKTSQAWVGHPYIDVIDNSTDFDTKMRRMISAICRRIGIDTEDRLQSSSKKIKFLVKGPVPADSVFPTFQDFTVVHDYLRTSNSTTQSRLRKRGQKNNNHYCWSYQHTIRRSDSGDQLVELRRQINHRDYCSLLSQKDETHRTIYKVRRCFIYKQTYFQMDMYKPCPDCVGPIMLETYSSLSSDELLKKVPPFLNVVKDVSKETIFSMFQLSMKSSKDFVCEHQKRNQESKQKRYNDERITMHQNSIKMKNGCPENDIECNTYHRRVKGVGVGDMEINSILSSVEGASKNSSPVKENGCKHTQKQ